MTGAEKITSGFPMLRIEGEVDRPLNLSFEDLQRLPDGQIPDVSTQVPGRQGGPCGWPPCWILRRSDRPPNMSVSTAHATISMPAFRCTPFGHEDC